ncbi:hypothetical protein BKA70DRAFT_1120071 [Coprinopsis sp. MPI-PUGE-AT-0042]|nr:hypothetical protein BKA70DRAFT_1120071 [Coprinopsis sp. MPI-PUGE-AT-0042]
MPPARSQDSQAGTEAFPRFLQKSQKIVNDSFFIISTFPNAEKSTAERYLHQLQAIKRVLQSTTDTSLTAEEIQEDARKDTIEFFRQIFQHMEDVGLLDPSSPLDLVCLYLVFQPRIQKSLEETVSSWNRHKVRTAGNRTLIALWELSRERAINAGYWTGDPGDCVSEVDEGYGVDGEATFAPPDDELAEDPSAPRSDRFGSREEEQEAGIFVTEDEAIQEAREILKDVDFEEDDGNWGIDIYCSIGLRLSTFYDNDNL